MAIQMDPGVAAFLLAHLSSKLLGGMGPLPSDHDVTTLRQRFIERLELQLDPMISLHNGYNWI